MTQPLSDFGAIAKRLFRFLRMASFAVIGVTLYLFVVNVIQTARMLHDSLHPAAGYGFAALVLGLAAWFVGKPLLRFFDTPRALRPPPMPEAAQRQPVHLVRHLRFVQRYIGNLRTNPEWDGPPEALDQALEAVRALEAEALDASTSDVADLGDRMARFERTVLAALLAPLDRKAGDVIRREALSVGVATAVSWNGAVDAFIVFWRNLNLVTRIARIYYGRPGVRGTLTILRDVSAATLTSAYLQDLTELAGGALGGVFGKSIGIVAAPLLDGGLNAVATLRIGYVAKARCRALEAWNERTVIGVVSGAVREAARYSKDVVTEVVKTVGGGVMHLPGKALSSIAESLSSMWRKIGGEPGAEPAGA